MKITLRPSVTLDGFIADLNGECYSWINPDDEVRYDTAVKQSGCELVGRKTYEQYKNDFDAREDIVTYVYTNQPKFENTPNVKFIGGSAEDAVSQIEKDGFSNLIISGGGELNGLLAEAKLIDEARLSIHPVLLYNGIPLFGSYKPKLNLELVESNTDVQGIVQATYKLIY
jgi:dihydrofolate reductase